MEPVFLKAWGWMSSLMETASIEGWALNLGPSSREGQEKERKWRNKQETNQESEVSQSRDWQEEPVVTTAHPIRGRDSGLRSLECGPPPSLEKTGNSNHLGFWRSPAGKTLPLPLGQHSVIFWTHILFHLAEQSLLVTCWGNTASEFTELWCVWCVF